MPSHNIQIYAKWNRPEYTVTFVTNGGSSVDAVTVPKGTVLDTSEYVTTKEDGSDEFLGWYTDEALTREFVSGTNVVQNITLYAKWESSNTVNYTVKHIDSCLLYTSYNKAITELWIKNPLVDTGIVPTLTGFGISYVLPIVVAGLWASSEPGSLLIIENPEAHLHPYSPVSYTHLDVYKRQLQAEPGSGGHRRGHRPQRSDGHDRHYDGTDERS